MSQSIKPMLKFCSVGSMYALMALMALLYPSGAHANVVNVNCVSNGDGTTSCLRLRDHKWFDCLRSTGGTSVCKSREVVQGRDEPITCIRDGGGIFSCTSAADYPSDSNLPGSSVF